VELLEAVADVLAEFSEVGSAGARVWDGSAYVPMKTSPFDPYAAKWFGVFSSLIGVLTGEDALSDKQTEYLDRLLFGGMGSFNDFVLDEERLGSAAVRANQQLDDLRKKLFEEFRRM
jgi:hypothetical protein